MPKGLATYDNCAVRVNGRYVAQSTSVSVAFMSADEVLYLLGGGTRRTMAINPSGRSVKVEWKMVCATDDTEDLRFVRQWRDVELVKIGVDMLGSLQGISTTGYLQDPRLDAKVGAALEYSVSAICDVTDFLGA